ncbi:MAG: hypothetical protein HOV81_09535 [Kofleriaceae bacterium]|nr:hypothetical protein [Kofleriaceae bacterium]
MRSLLLLLLVVVASCSDELPPLEILDDHAVAMAVAGNELYWAAERDGLVELNRRSPEGTRRVWRSVVAERGQVFVVAGPDGAVLVERPLLRPSCARFHWIDRDGTSEDLTAAALCDAYPIAQLDGGLLFMLDNRPAIFQFDLRSGAVTTWFDIPDMSLLFPTARESYAAREGVDSFDLVRIEQSGEVRTLATIERADRFALSPDAIYWTRPGWDSRPTTVTRVPRDGSGPAVDVLAIGALTENGQPPFLEHMAWVDELWVTDGAALYRVDDGELVLVGSTKRRPWGFAAYDGALVMLTEDGVDGLMRVQLQRLP